MNNLSTFASVSIQSMLW